ncbi:uncharacterized protein [Battus philenor]|uniref:uncharacterized protein n=1 Tax=Battus philenor TaxID=42288 RepID=UPI0035CF7EE4
MDFKFCITVLSLCSSLVDAFFLFAEKNEPIWFCFKICPLYCGHRRYDRDVSSHIYWDEGYAPIYDEPEVWPYHYFCKPTKPMPTTTTPKPTTMATTTEEPTWICMTCMKKCGSPKSK